MVKRLAPRAVGMKPRASSQSVAVFEALKAAIATGAQPSGQALPKTRDLMARFGVGRTAVLDAIAALGELGLVVSSDAGRATVALPTLDGVVARVLSHYAPLVSASPAVATELGRARSVFLRDLVRDVAVRADPLVAADLKAAHERRAGLDGDPAEAGRAFWSRLAQASGSRLYRLILKQILEGADAPWMSLDAERRLVDFIRAGDARAAEALLDCALNAAA